MTHSSRTLAFKTPVAVVGALFLFTAGQSCASPRSRVRTTTRSVAAPSSTQSNQSVTAAGAAGTPKYYLNVIGSNTDEVRLVNTPSVAFDRVRLFTERRLGLYPKFWDGRPVHGGLPQLADLNAHLARVRHDVVAAIPDSAWDGFAVIDYEAWHLTWKHMPELYREESRKVVRTAHPDLPETQVEEIARGQFESAAFAFITKTLELCRQLRPKARWGMYGYPRTPDPARIDGEAALFAHVDAIYPSIYARHWSVVGVPQTHGQAKVSRYKKRIDAIITLSKTIAQGRPVLAYTWPRYNTSNPAYRGKPLNNIDLEMMLTEPLAAGADGVILWGGIVSHTRAVEYQKIFLERMLPLTRSVTRSATTATGLSPAVTGSSGTGGAAPQPKKNQRSRRRRMVPSPKL